MEKKKKIWAGPKLIALVRRKLEENILGGCKHQEMQLGPESADVSCRYVAKGCGACSGLGQT